MPMFRGLQQFSIVNNAVPGSPDRLLNIFTDARRWLGDFVMLEMTFLGDFF